MMTSVMSFPQNLQNDSMNQYFSLDIFPHTHYIGYPDGFNNDNFMNFSVLYDSSEKWIYYNMDNKFFHPNHFHLTSGYAISDNPCVDEKNLYAKDVYSIGPQQKISFYLKFLNFISGQGKIPNLGYMYHCHFMGHHDMNMMGQYFVFSKIDLLKKKNN
jgi:FtsP/CotA-like multicopper oxidase with cupredoxin domain